MTVLCEILNIPRPTFYSAKQPILIDTIAENTVIEVFKSSLGIDGTRKIKVALAKQGIILSRRNIDRIMRKYGLVSKCTDFHTGCGREFKIGIIEVLLKFFNIQRSLSHKGCPYNNALAKSIFKIIKVEFIRGLIFESLEALQMELSAYVQGFNTQKIHGALNHMTSQQYRPNMIP